MGNAYTMSKEATAEIREKMKSVKSKHYFLHRHTSGMGSNLIAKKLRDIGAKCYRGGTWTGKRIIDIIKNEKYAGNALLQKKYVADHLTKRLPLCY